MATYGDAIMAGMIASMDPMTMVMRSMMQTQAKAAEEGLNDARIETMAKLRKAIKECQDNGEDPKVTAAYQRMLDSYAS